MTHVLRKKIPQAPLSLLPGQGPVSAVIHGFGQVNLLQIPELLCQPGALCRTASLHNTAAARTSTAASQWEACKGKPR